MSFISVASGQPIRATHVQQFTSWLTAQKIDTPGTIAATSTTEYTLTVRSQDGGTGLALNVLYGSASSPSTIATFNKSQITLASPVRVTGTTPLALVQIAAPSSGPAVGFSSLYPKTDGTLAYKVGTAATEYVVATTGALFSNPLTTAGDLIYSSGGTTPARLAVGTAYQSLTVNAAGTGVTWATGLLGQAVTAGDLFYATGANAVTRLAKGTARQALIMNSAATAPSWGDSLASLLSTAGDIAYASSANTPDRLGIGATGTVLHGGGTAPSYSAVTTADIATNAASQIAFASGSTATPITTSATMASLADMSVVIVTTGGELEAEFSGSFYGSTVAELKVGLSLDGAAVVSSTTRATTLLAANQAQQLHTFHLFTGVSATTHTIAVMWSCSDGTGASYGVMRGLMVRERKR